VILVDTSAWVEFLRDAATPVADRLEALLDDEVATCSAVRMEVLAGARDDVHLQRLRRLLARAVVLPTTEADYDDAATLYQTGRRSGVTMRGLVDCLIAAVAIRHDVPVLHADRDFVALGRVTSLRLDQA
jgi:predicted nucleic acid-binding protein